MTSRRVSLRIALVLGLMITAPAWSAPPGPRDPDWPCQQIKVPQLSLAAVWSGPPVEAQQDDWRQEPQVAALVQAVVQRRMPVEQAQEKIRAFAVQAADRKQPKLLKVLEGVFALLDAERGTVIAGLDRFGARQKELAAALRDDNEKLRAMQSDLHSGAGEIDQMVQRVTWEARVFQDRRQALAYVCDVPGKIEQRLFALARTIQDALE